MPVTIKFTNNSTIKRRPIQSSELPESEKQEVQAGQEFEIQSYDQERNHVRVAFSKNTFNGFNTWYAFAGHIQLLKDKVPIFPPAKPKTVKLPVPYKSQRDNQENPNGSCNVTSLAMCLEYLGAKRRQASGQFEDELYQYAIDTGLSRHNPHDLAKIVEAYGCRDYFRTDATIDQVKLWLAAQRPIVIHGYFTTFGHIVVLTGYDETGFLAHDPYGEWNSWGYDLNVPGLSNLKGKCVHYSYTMIRKLCIPDGSFWVHFLFKESKPTRENQSRFLNYFHADI